MAKFIAELGANHNGDPMRLIELIDTAANVGCDGVKVQLFDADKVFAPEVMEKSETHRSRRAWLFPIQWLKGAAEWAHLRDMELGASVYALEDIPVAAEHCDFLKISSYDLLRLDLIKACAETGKPLVISTGMATKDQVGDAVRAVGNTNNLTLLHCVSAYPTPPEATALGRIDVLRCDFDVLTGLSDHSRNPGIICEAFWCEQADPIEFHLDLEDGEGLEYGDHCWKPSEIAPVIACCQETTTIKSSVKLQFKESLWRADPSDGLRPMKSERGKL